MLRLSNKNKLAVNFIVLLLIGLLASTLIAYLHVKNWQEQAIQSEIQLKASFVTTDLNHWVQQSLEHVDNFAIFLANLDEDLQNHPDFSEYLKQHPRGEGLEYLGYVVDADGYYGIKNWQVPDNFDPRVRPWYIEGKAADRPIIGRPYISIENTPRRLLAVTAPITVQGKFKGLASAHVELDYVQKSLAALDLQMQGQAFLVDEQGKVMVHQDNDQLGSLWPGFSEAVADYGSNQRLLSVSESTTHLYYISKQMPDIGSYLVFAISKSMIEHELLQETAQLLGKFLMVFVVIMFCLYLSNRHILSPLFDYMELDSVTLLPSKKHFKQQLVNDFLLSDKRGQLLIINMDNFSRLTATYPAAQIHLLQNEIKKRIQAQLSGRTLLGNFAESRYIAYSEWSKNSNENLLDGLSHDLAEPYDIAGQEIYCTFRIGVSHFPEHGTEIETLIDNSFSALANVSRLHGGHFGVFSPAINQQFSDAQFIHNAMKKAIRTGEFTMVYQPQINTALGEIFAVEALIRWYSCELDRNVSPLEFIPIAESSGLMVPLGDYIIDTVFQQIWAWNEQGVKFGVVSINISPQQLLTENFYEKLMQSVSKYHILATQVEFEITETLLVEDPNASIEILQKISAQGFTIAIDDFGTGYSSLEYLNMMPLNKLKIDRAFVIDLDINHKSALLVKTIISMAENLNLDVLAEGVETIEEAMKLSELGCNKIQGYLYSKPLPAEYIPAFIEHNIEQVQAKYSENEPA